MAWGGMLYQEDAGSGPKDLAAQVQFAAAIKKT